MQPDKSKKEVHITQHLIVMCSFVQYMQTEKLKKSAHITQHLIDDDVASPTIVLELNRALKYLFLFSLALCHMVGNQNTCSQFFYLANIIANFN
jgi:hypothetical protein